MRRSAMFATLTWSLAALFIPVVGSGQERPPEGSASSRRFVGNYELVSFETFGEDGAVTRRETVGRIMYDAAGNMAAQLMPRNRPEVPSGAGAEERWAANRGYTAYFGRYEVDWHLGQVTHKVRGSVRQSWVGRDLVRYFEFEDELLKLSLKRDNRVTGTLTWRRID